MATNTQDYTGIQKAAILLIALGPERSADIFKHLKEDEIEELTLEIANTRSVSPQVKEDVLNEFYQICLAQQYIAEGGIGYAKELLDKALGEDRAKEVITKLTASLQVRPFEFVRKTDPSQLLNFIQDEHPQTIAMISPGCTCDWSTSAGKTGRCCKTYCNDGSYISGCDQRGRACVRKETFFPCQPGLHHCWRCGCHRKHFKYGRPYDRKTYYGVFGDRRTGTGRRDPQEDVCIRGYFAA